MSYQVISRKWRPQKFSEVVYQDHVSRSLINAIQKDKIGHAYLFSGPRGVGKTTMARILAKSLNCLEGLTPNPCGKCENCIEILKGNSFDVLEIDGASNNGIDNIRELRENVNVATLKSRYKIYIIDEVHMVSTAAFNALLKTLEEPPKHVIFVLATTEINKIPDTIQSRCLKFFFKKMSVDSIVDHLKKIADQENYSLSDKVLYTIGRSAEGSMRDAQSLLDQVLIYADETLDEKSNSTSKKSIPDQEALSILGIIPLDSYARQIKNISNLDAKALIEEIDQIFISGVDIDRYVLGFAEVLRLLRLAKNNISLNGLFYFSDEEIDLLTSLKDFLEEEELSSFFKITSKLQYDLKLASSERVNLEMAFLDMLSIKKTPSVAEIIGQLSQINDKNEPVSRDINSRPSLSDQQQDEKKKKVEQIKSKDEISKTSSENILPSLKQEWQKFLTKLQSQKQYLHFILAKAKIDYRDGTLYLSYLKGAEDSFYTKVLESKNLSYLKKEFLSKLSKGGSGIKLAVEQNENHAQGKPGTDFNYFDDNREAPLPEEIMRPEVEFSSQTIKNPLVEKIKKEFKGEIIN